MPIPLTLFTLCMLMLYFDEGKHVCAGMFGTVILGPLLFLMYKCITAYPPFTSDSGGKLENVPDAFDQMNNDHWIIVIFMGMSLIVISWYSYLDGNILFLV